MSEIRQHFVCQLIDFRTESLEAHTQEVADIAILSPLHHTGTISRCQATEELFNAPLNSIFTCSGVLREKFLGLHYSLEQGKQVALKQYKIAYPKDVNIILRSK